MKLLNTLLLSLICLSRSCFAEFIPTNDFKVIKEYVNKADKDTFIFDVDDVLMMPTDDFAANASIRKKLKEKYSKNELRYLYSCLFERQNVQPVDANMRGLIKNLEQRNIPTIALTG